MGRDRARGRRAVLITGASSGLGREMARLFARRGHDLALCARRLAPMEQLKQELSDAGVTIAVRQLDVCDHARVFSVFEELDATLGGLDRVIVNAGIAGGGSIGTGAFAANRAILETNVVAALAQCEAAIELFRARDAGHLVLMSSMSAVRGLSGEIMVYGASKAALAKIGESLAVEFSDSPIRVSTIFGGLIRTPLNDHISELPLRVPLEQGAQAIVDAIDREPRTACVPAWPWRPLGTLMRLLPDKLIKKMEY